MEIIQVNTYADLESLFLESFARIFDDDVDVNFNPELLQVRFKLNGDKFHSSLTPTIMRSVLSLQETIYDVFLRNAYNDSTRRLTNEIKEKLEMSFVVTAGCTDLLAEFGKSVDFLKELVKGMTGSQKAALIAAVIAAFSLKSIGQISSDHIIKEKQISIEAKRVELEATRDQINHREKIELMKLAEKSIESAITTRENALRTLSRENFESIEIDSNEYVPITLKERVKTERKRVPIVKVPIESDFLITAINLDDPSTILIDVIDQANQKEYRNIDILKDFMTEEDFSVIKSALNREPIRMRIVLDVKNEKILGAILQSIIH